MEDFLQQQLTIFLQLFPAAAAVAVVSKLALPGEIHAAGNAIVTSVREAGASAAGAASEEAGGGGGETQSLIAAHRRVITRWRDYNS